MLGPKDAAVKQLPQEDSQPQPLKEKPKTEETPKSEREIGGEEAKKQQTPPKSCSALTERTYVFTVGI